MDRVVSPGTGGVGSGGSGRWGGGSLWVRARVTRLWKDFSVSSGRDVEAVELDLAGHGIEAGRIRY